MGIQLQSFHPKTDALDAAPAQSHYSVAFRCLTGGTVGFVLVMVQKHKHTHTHIHTQTQTSTKYIYALFAKRNLISTILDYIMLLFQTDFVLFILFNQFCYLYFRIMDLFGCSVCFNDMLERSPRILFCLHSFCTECLQQIINNNKINCPTCREITELKSNDVKELKVNFNLRQMKEQMEGQKEKEKKKPPPVTKATFFCQICHQRKALFKCRDCAYWLCGPCKNRHGNIDDFKTHSVFDLCQTHDEGITHLCKQCVLPLCPKCMLLDHTKHTSHFVNYEKGIEVLQNDARVLQGKIKKEIVVADQHYDEIKAKYQSFKDMEDACQDQKQNLRDKIREVEEKFIQKAAELEAACNEEKQHLKEKLKEADDVIRERKVYEDVTELYNKERIECNMAVASLNSLLTSDALFCDRYKKIIHKADQCLVDIKKVVDVEFTVPPIVMTYSSPGESVNLTPSVHKLMNLKVKHTLLTIKQSDEINGMWGIAFIEDDVLLTTGKKPYHVIRLDMKGRVVNWYYPQDTDKQVHSVCVYNNDIYMLQSDTITVIPHYHEKNIIYNFDIESMCGILVKDKSTIFISQVKNPGNIYKYDTVHDTTEVVVEGLKKPDYMSMMYTKEGYKYIITEEAGHIKVYNSSWELLHSFGSEGTADGQFGKCSPMATTVTDMGTILVADQGNHRISHFTIEGQFLSHVATKDDGIEVPIGLCYKHPYLWVTAGDENLRCVEITKTEHIK